MLLQLTNVTKTYPSGEQTLDVLRDLNLSLERGQAVSVVGPSGSGKSTLLNIVGALDRPTSGDVLLDGQDLTKLADDQLAALRNEKLGFVFQAHHLLPQCTVLENVLVPTLVNPAHRGKPETVARARQLLERVGLKERIGHRPGQLSGGERQRVAVVRALINQPLLLLADEPTGALDQTTAEGLSRLLLELNREEGVAMIVVTHSVELAAEIGTVMELRDRKLVLRGSDQGADSQSE